MKDFLKNLINNIFKVLTYIGIFVFLFFVTLSIFWPFIALVVILICVFWFFLPIIAWIIFGISIVFIFLYIICNLN